MQHKLLSLSLDCLSIKVLKDTKFHLSPGQTEIELFKL